MENNISIRDLISNLDRNVVNLTKKIDDMDKRLDKTREAFIEKIGDLKTNIAVLKVKNGLLSALLGLLGGAIPVGIFIVIKAF